MSLLGEIKRRKVFQVAAVYIVVAWLMIQVVDVLNEPLSLPDWLDSVVVVLLLVGFPVALVLAWALDLTPQGIVRTPPENTENIEGVISESSEPKEPERIRKPLSNSVAVLAFENLSLEAKDAFFAVGIHEAILNELAKIRDLSVMSRTSVLAYSGGGLPISRIAEELNVQTVMEGSVQYANNRVRITAQLIDASTGAHLWSEHYDRDFSDIFVIQTDIASRIASALQAELTPQERETLAQAPTESSEAYARYLSAIALPALSGGLEVTPEQSIQCHQYLDQALAIDPEFALPYASKAREYAYSIGRAVRRSDELTIPMRDELAQENAARALSLDSNSGLAYAALAVAHRFARRDEMAKTAFARALELSPSDARVLRDLAFFYVFRGRAAEALEVARRIVDLDPALGYFLVGWSLWPLGDFDGAVAAGQQVITLRPDFSMSHGLVGMISTARGDSDLALKSLRLAETLGLAKTAWPAILAQTAFAYSLLNRDADATRFFRLVEAQSEEYIVEDATWALAYLAVGEQEQALAALTRAAETDIIGLDTTEVIIAANYFGAPELEQREFLEIRRNLLGFVK